MRKFEDLIGTFDRAKFDLMSEEQQLDILLDLYWAYISENVMPEYKKAAAEVSAS